MQGQDRQHIAAETNVSSFATVAGASASDIAAGRTTLIDALRGNTSGPCPEVAPVVGEPAPTSSSVKSEFDQIVGRDAARQKGESISPLSELPSDYDFVVTQTDEDKVKYIQQILALSEDDAIKVVAPAIRMYKTAADVVTAYLPLIRVLKEHYCQKGRPKTHPVTKQRNRTWGDVCTQSFGISLRRMQQILALDGQEKLPNVSTSQSKTKIDRRAYERAVTVAEPAAKLSQAVVAEGLGGRFPEALEVLKLAEIPIPAVQAFPEPPQKTEQVPSSTESIPIPKSGDWSGLVASVNKLSGKYLKAVLSGLEPDVAANVFGMFAQQLARTHCHYEFGLSELRVTVSVLSRKASEAEKKKYGLVHGAA